ncbi:MAG TPA: metallophosphoesterase [Paludibacteraceae bacterium]|nr:metallophosphoesterase [Paludibacteraceae bacterium]
MKYGFFFVFFTFLLSIIAYTTIRGYQTLAPYGNFKTVYLVSMVVLSVVMFAGIGLENQLPHGLAKGLSFVGHTFFIVAAYLFISFLLTDIFRAVNHFVPLVTNIQAFRLGAMVGTLAILTVLLVWGNYKFNHPQKVQLTIHSNKSHKKNREIKIVAVSDIHLGTSIDKKRLRQYVDLINAEKPDLVLIAGDLIDRSIKPVISQKMDEELRTIQAPMGVYVIFGNHEYYGEGDHHIADFYRKSNITLLRDTSVVINNELLVVGRDDKHNPNRRHLKELFPPDTDKPVIVLDHQPYHLQEAESSRVDLQISGHTHNGQFFPANLIVKSMFELGYGHLKKGNTHFYVSSGLGLWGPQYRLGSQSELVVVNFRF